MKTAPAVSGQDCNNVSPTRPPTTLPCSQTDQYRAATYLYPRQCDLGDLAGGDVDRLRKCGLNYELHPQRLSRAMAEALLAGLRQRRHARQTSTAGRRSCSPASRGCSCRCRSRRIRRQRPHDLRAGLQLEHLQPVPARSPTLPTARADFRAARTRDTQFYHTLLMSNHMEAEPDIVRATASAARCSGTTSTGRRRCTTGYSSTTRQAQLPARDVRRVRSTPTRRLLPFHNNTCDGVPRAQRKRRAHQARSSSTRCCQKQYMTADEYNAQRQRRLHLHRHDPPDEAGVLRPAARNVAGAPRCIALLGAARVYPADVVRSRRGTAQADDLYYNNKIMNYYGDSFHVKKATSSTTGTSRQPTPNRHGRGRRRASIRELRQGLRAAADPAR